MQEAFVVASERWPRDGVPEHPGAWLVSTARNRAIDRIRRERTFQEKARQIAREMPVAQEMEPMQSTFPDERLELIFTCAHPALSLEAQVALTLRTLGGLQTPRDRDGASWCRRRRWHSASCAPSARSGRRASRSACRPAHLLPDRLAAVLAVIYLIFNAGYEGRGDLAGEAIRLGSALAELMPDEAEVHGLLALMLLHDSRREARFAGGEIVLLDEQDRSLWDERRILAGRAELARAGTLGRPGPVHAAGVDRGAAHGARDGLGARRGPLRRAPGADRLAGRGAQPRRRDRPGARAAGGP